MCFAFQGGSPDEDIEGRAQGRFGIDIILGNPSGFVWKYKINHVNAIDGEIGFLPYDRFRFNFDYLGAHIHSKKGVSKSTTGRKRSYGSGDRIIW